MQCLVMMDWIKHGPWGATKAQADSSSVHSEMHGAEAVAVAVRSVGLK